MDPFTQTQRLFELADFGFGADTFVVTGLVGLFTDPGHVVRSAIGTVRQQFVVVFHARAVAGSPHGDAHDMGGVEEVRQGRRR